MNDGIPYFEPPENMHQQGRYWESNANPTRLAVYTPETFEQLLALPLGTELAMFKVVMTQHGPAVAGTILIVTEGMRTMTRKYIEQGEELEYDFGVYLLPENAVPDEVPELKTGD